jgi:Rieske Fe-S protein
LRGRIELLAAVQRNSLLFFFVSPCRKNAGNWRTWRENSFGEWNMHGLKLGAMVAALLAASLPAWGETTVLKNVTVIDGTGAAPMPASAIVMTDGKIAWVGPVASLKAPKDAKVRDMSGKFVMPGIIDSHVHVGMMHDVTQDEKYETPENVQADLKTYAAYGVTAV